MTAHRKFLLTAAAVLACGVVSAASAQVEGSALKIFVDEMAEADKAERVDWIDLDNDEQPEALLVLPADVHGAREWRLIDDKGGAPRHVFSWSANEIKVVHDTQNEGRALVWSDGVTFGYGYQDSFRPLGDIKALNGQGLSRATAPDAELAGDLAGTPGGFSREDLQVLRTDLFPGQIMPGNERLIIVMSEGFRDADMRAQYFIVNQANDLVHSGWSLTGPYLYHHASGGLSIVEDSIEAYSLIFVPPAKEGQAE